MKKVWFAALAFWVVASTSACWLYPVTLYDPCARYAPMADAFAAGNFVDAFHPRFGLLFSILAGSFSWLTGLAGIYTVQIASFLLLALSGAVAFAFARRLTNSTAVAWWTFVLVLLYPDFFRYALDGLREPAKCLVFALIGYGVVACKGWAFGLGLFIYIISFAYGFAASSVLLLVWCVWRAYKCEWRQLMGPVVSWLVGSAAVTALVYTYTGHCVPAPQFIELLGRWL